MGEAEAEDAVDTTLATIAPIGAHPAETEAHIDHEMTETRTVSTQLQAPIAPVHIQDPKNAPVHVPAHAHAHAPAPARAEDQANANIRHRETTKQITPHLATYVGWIRSQVMVDITMTGNVITTAHGRARAATHNTLATMAQAVLAAYLRTAPHPPNIPRHQPCNLNTKGGETWDTSHIEMTVQGMNFTN